MLAARLVFMVEKHAEELTMEVVKELRSDPRTSSYHNLALNEDHSRVFAVVRHLGEWLDCNSDAATEAAYRSLGQRRFSEGIPLAEVVCALLLTKQTINRYIQSEAWMDSALDLRQQSELFAQISRFFERAIYFTVLSYEAEARLSGNMAGKSEPHNGKFTHGWGSKKHAKAV